MSRQKWSRTVAAVLLVVPVLAGSASGTGPRAPAREGRAAGGEPVRLAQLASVGTVENATGLFVVRRADTRVDQLQGRGPLPLYEGDECRTEHGARAFIKLADGTQMAVNEDTTFVVRTRTDSGVSVRIFKLFGGELWMKAAGARPIEIETPVATAVLKGAQFNLRVHPDGKSILSVVDGTVELETPFGGCAIRAATQSVGERGKPCTPPVAMDPGPVIAWTAGVVR